LVTDTSISALDRHVSWDGFYNARDLGGLPTRDGRVTRAGQLFRSALPRFVTTDGWQQAYDAGVRTVLDLRSDPEVVDEEPVADDGLTRLRVALDPWDDQDFWTVLKTSRRAGTPLYFSPLLTRKPVSVAAVVTAIARAQPGGVLFHCAAGRDRTGVLSLLLLGLAGVDADMIADDYDLSHEPLRAMFVRAGRDVAELDEVLQAMVEHGLSTRDVVRQTLAEFDVQQYLIGAGVAVADLAAIRHRLIGLG
jgi:hypothetical protein